MGYEGRVPAISELFPHSEHAKELNVAYGVVQDAIGFSGHSYAPADSCFVTLIVADFAAQLIIVKAIRESFPDDAIIAEEDTASLSDDQIARIAVFTDTGCLAKLLTEHSSTKSRFWVIDPIDGTLGYIDDGQYACCIGLLEDGKVVMSVLGCPRLVTPLGKGAIFIAARGCGSFLVCPDSGEWSKLPLACGATDPAVTLAESREKKHSDMSFSQKLMAKLGIENRLSMDSQCKYGLVAARCAHVFLRKSANPNYQTRIWDHAPGALIVKEAGGKVTDFAGKALGFQPSSIIELQGGILATNLDGVDQLTHDQILSTIKKMLVTE